jgi:hypothetical protein
MRVWIAIHYGQKDPGFRTLVGDRRFFLYVFQTESGAHTASYTVITGPPSVEKSGRGAALTIHPIIALTLRKSRAYPYSPFYLLWHVMWCPLSFGVFTGVLYGV